MSHSRSLADTPAVILAGGLGTRLRSAVADRPKVLAQVAGRPFLAYLLDQVQAAGCRTVVLCTGYLGELVEREFGTSYRGLPIVYSREHAPLGTGGALRLAASKLTSDHVLVLNGDSYCAADLSAFGDWHVTRSAPASLLLTRVEDTSRFGRVALDANEYIQAFEEKGETIGPGLINAGVYLLERTLLSRIPSDEVISLERQMFPEWIAQGLHGYPTAAAFIDIGVPASYALAEQFLGRLAA